MKNFLQLKTVSATLISATIAIAAGIANATAITTAAVATAVATDTSAYAAETNHPLDNLNGAFHAAYLNDMKDSLLKTNPIILVEGNKLVLLKSAKREESEFIPANWNTLKEVDHGPLGLFVLLNPRIDTTFDTATIEKIKNFQQLFKKSKEDLSSYGLSQALLDRQNKIADKSLVFIEALLLKRSVTPAELQSFTRSTTALLMDNVDDDIAMELSRVDTQMQKWKAQMTDDQWRSMYVVIEGGHMPRTNETLSQYFALLLNEPNEGHRWIYAENVSSEKEALDLLAKHIVDATIAVDFFGEPMRMHRDLLGDAAKKYLIAHPPLQESHWGN